MQFAVFEHFKSEKTLLVWGAAHDLQPLADAFADLAGGLRRTVVLDRSLGATAVGGAQVSIELGSSEAMTVRKTGEGLTVQLHCSRGKCGEIANQLHALTATPDFEGHQYLELTPDQPMQVIVSAGEYPPDLKPS